MLQRFHVLLLKGSVATRIYESPCISPCDSLVSQVMEEVSKFLQMMDEVYTVFGLQYKMALSTRPDDYMGELPQWEKAEAALTEALNASGKEWEVRRMFACTVLKHRVSMCTCATNLLCLQ